MLVRLNDLQCLYAPILDITCVEFVELITKLPRLQQLSVGGIRRDDCDTSIVIPNARYKDSNVIPELKNWLHCYCVYPH